MVVCKIYDFGRVAISVAKAMVRSTEDLQYFLEGVIANIFLECKH